MNREDRAAQIARALRIFAQKAQLSEEEVRQIADLFAPWAADKNYTAGEKVTYGVSAAGRAQPYIVVQNHTSQAHQPPNAPGMLALYQPVAHRYADDSFEYIEGMTGITGMVVRFGGQRWEYLPAGGTAVIWAPSPALAAIWRLV